MDRVCQPEIGGTSLPMEIMGPFNTITTNAVDDAAARFAVVHTDDDEDLVFRGATEDEVKAKLDDFMTWAS